MDCGIERRIAVYRDVDADNRVAARCAFYLRRVDRKPPFHLYQHPRWRFGAEGPAAARSDDPDRRQTCAGEVLCASRCAFEDTLPPAVLARVGIMRKRHVCPSLIAGAFG